MGSHPYVHIDIQNYEIIQPEESGNSVFVAVNLGFVAHKRNFGVEASGILWPNCRQ